MLELGIANLQDAIAELEKRIARLKVDLQSQISSSTAACDCSEQITTINTEITTVKASITDFDTRLKKVEVALNITSPTVEIE